MPFSTTYELHDYGFGSGGSGVSDSATYTLSGISGENSGIGSTSPIYGINSGLTFIRQSNVPAAPAFVNDANYYNKLKFTLDTGDNPSDTKFAIAISTDDFATTNYVQADNTLGATAVYQTYTAWGGGSGAYVIGLQSSTTYKIKVKAVQTKYNESAYSVAASASTDAPSLSYDLDVSATDSETAAPYTVSFGTLTVGSVTTAASKIWVDLSTNAESGAFVYIYNSSSGLFSSNANYTIVSSSTNLATDLEGYGLQVSSVTQSSGGPLSSVSPYNGAAENVGILDTTTRNVFTSGSAPIVNGRGSIYVKAKAATTTPAAGDYASTVTMIASAAF